jgi:hypothetical protein
VYNITQKITVHHCGRGKQNGGFFMGKDRQHRAHHGFGLGEIFLAVICIGVMWACWQMSQKVINPMATPNTQLAVKK